MVPRLPAEEQPGKPSESAGRKIFAQISRRHPTRPTAPVSILKEGPNHGPVPEPRRFRHYRSVV